MLFRSQLLQLCRRHIWALILWSVGLALVGWGIANFVISPKYSSSAQILVNQKSNKNDPNAAYTTQQANMQLVNTYKDIVTSHVILKDASDRLANPVRVVKKAKPAKYRTTGDGRKVLVRKAQPAVIERDGKAYSVSAKQLASSISVTYLDLLVGHQLLIDQLSQHESHFAHRCHIHMGYSKPLINAYASVSLLIASINFDLSLSNKS